MGWHRHMWGIYSTPEFFSPSYSDGALDLGNIPAAINPKYGSSIIALIPNYSANGGFYKVGFGLTGYAFHGQNAGAIATGGGVWLRTDPITRIRVFGLYVGATRHGFLAGTKISLYGFG